MSTFTIIVIESTTGDNTASKQSASVFSAEYIGTAKQYAKDNKFKIEYIVNNNKVTEREFRKLYRDSNL